MLSKKQMVEPTPVQMSLKLTWSLSGAEDRDIMIRSGPLEKKIRDKNRERETVGVLPYKQTQENDLQTGAPMNASKPNIQIAPNPLLPSEPIHKRKFVKNNVTRIGPIDPKWQTVMTNQLDILVVAKLHKNIVVKDEAYDKKKKQK